MCPRNGKLRAISEIASAISLKNSTIESEAGVLHGAVAERAAGYVLGRWAEHPCSYAQALVGRLRQIIALLVVLTIVDVGFGSSDVVWIRDLGSGTRFGLLAAIVAVGALAIARGVRSAARIILQPYFGVWVVLLALAFLSTLWSIEPSASFKHAASLTLLVAAVVVCVVVSGAEPALFIRAVAAGIVFVFVLSTLLAIVRPHLAFQPAFNDQGTGSVRRFQGLTENPDELASYGTIATPLLLWLVSATRGKTRRGWIAAMILVFVEIVISGSRIPLGIVVLQALAYLFFIVRNRRLNLAALSLLAVAIVAVASASVVSSHARDRVFRLNSGITTLSGRTVAWKAGLHLLARRPAEGFGFDTESTVFLGYLTAHPGPFIRAHWSGAYVHNSYIGLGDQIGVGGIACALALLAWPMVRLRGQFSDGPNFAIASAVIGGAFFALFSSFFSAAGNVLTFELWFLAALPFAYLSRGAARRGSPAPAGPSASS
jgi:hypothetical protein